MARDVTLAWVATGAAALVIGCGSISVVSDGGHGSGSGGNIDVTTGTGGATAGSGGKSGMGGSGAGGSGAGGNISSSGGASGAGGAPGAGGTGTGGMIAGTGGSGGVTGTGGRIADAGVDRGACICPDVIALVCGADGITYNNSCLAGCAGVTVAHMGACVDAGVVACRAVPGCCSADSDCNANEECAGTTCGADGRANGVCKARPNRNGNGNRCWTDADCAGQNNNNNCTGAIVCPCGSLCLRPDALGMCN